MWPRRPFRQHQVGEENKALLQTIVESGTVPSLLAYVEGVPAGWCSIGPRPDYVRFFDEHAGREIWLIACLFIAKSHRGQWVGSALIDAAVRRAAQHGARSIEALPRGWRPDDDPTTIDAIRRMFRRAGFTNHVDATAPARVHKDLSLSQSPVDGAPRLP
ncbi:MAG: GNAT family N-acetyltransferase [Dehalococcoidia bacterium]